MPSIYELRAAFSACYTAVVLDEYQASLDAGKFKAREAMLMSFRHGIASQTGVPVTGDPSAAILAAFEDVTSSDYINFIQARLDAGEWHDANRGCATNAHLRCLYVRELLFMEFQHGAASTIAKDRQKHSESHQSK